MLTTMQNFPYQPRSGADIFSGVVPTVALVVFIVCIILMLFRKFLVNKVEFVLGDLIFLGFFLSFLAFVINSAYVIGKQADEDNTRMTSTIEKDYGVEVLELNWASSGRPYTADITVKDDNAIRVCKMYASEDQKTYTIYCGTDGVSTPLMVSTEER